VHIDSSELQQFLNGIDWNFVQGQTGICECGRRYHIYGIRRRCPECSRLCMHLEACCITGYIIATNGVKQPKKLCLNCGILTGLRKDTPHSDLILRDNRNFQYVEPCERCESQAGTEWHHWAPSAIFGWWEADRWPKSYLCTTCHRIWHQMMRKAGGWRLAVEQRISIQGHDGQQPHEVRRAA
jgi:hypothetical protein